MDGWEKVIDSLAADASIFAYTRPGYGNSPQIDDARDGTTIVEELRQFLKHKGLAPPYVLVGHSLGGLYMQRFIKRDPQEVSGLVLVDPLFPVSSRSPRNFLSGHVEQSDCSSRAPSTRRSTPSARPANRYYLAPIDDKPIVMLINKPKSATAIGVDVGAFNKDQRTRGGVNGMYPKAKRIILDSITKCSARTPPKWWARSGTSSRNRSQAYKAAR